MSSQFPNGAKYAFASLLATPVLISAITNAAAAVATTATPPAEGDVVLITSGWGALNNTPRKAGAVTANTFVVSGFDSTDTTRFPAGEGIGTYLATGDFIAIDQIRDVAQAGGEQSYFQWQYVDDETNTQQQRPTTKSPRTMTLTLDYDADKPWYDGLSEADLIGKPIVVRERLRDGVEIYYFGYPSFNEVPAKTVNENMTNVFTLSLISKPVRISP